MFDKGKHKYRSDVELGKVYKDTQTGIEGTSIAVTFFQHACERVIIETVVNGKIEEYSFDAPRLVSKKDGEQVGSQRPGGPGRAIARSPEARQPGSAGRR